MRKLSELLEICSRYNRWFTGNPFHSRGMCIAAEEAEYREEITVGEANLVADECSRLVKEVSGDVLYMDDAIWEVTNLSIGLAEQMVPLVYGAWIDKLKSEGK